MESFAVAVAETFEFMQPFCSAAMRKQAAFASAPLKNAGSNHTLATETDMTAERHHHDDEVPHKHASSVAQQRVHYLQERCDTSLTSSLSEDEMLLPYDPSFYTNTSSSLVGASNYYHYYYAGGRPVPTQVTFFTPKQRTGSVELSSRLSIQWHVRRAAGGFKGVDEWTGKLLEPAVDARQDTGEECLGYVTCFRVSPTFQLPVTAEEHQALALVHPHLTALAQYMHANTTLTNTHTTTTTGGGAMTLSSSSLSSASLSSSSSSQDNKPLFGLPLVLITHVQVSTEYRGMGLGLLLVDETCRCLANPAQWVLLGTTEQSLREYFGLLGFTGSALLDGQVIIRWNDPYCMATHRYEDLCPHLPRVVIQ